jgi:lipoprotein-releasing system permease protein
VRAIREYLGIRVNFITPLKIVIPRRNSVGPINPDDAITKRFIFPSGIFQVEQDYDSKYVYVPLSFARELIEKDSAITSIEIKYTSGIDAESIQIDVS